MLAHARNVMFSSRGCASSKFQSDFNVWDLGYPGRINAMI